MNGPGELACPPLCTDPHPHEWENTGRDGRAVRLHSHQISEAVSLVIEESMTPDGFEWSAPMVHLSMPDDGRLSGFAAAALCVELSAAVDYLARRR